MIFMHRDPVGVAARWLGNSLLHCRRWPIQLAGLIAVNTYFFPWFKRIPCTTLNCSTCPAAIFACPIGTLQYFAINRMVPFYTLGLLGITGLLVGSLSCGWFCPFGWLQDLLAKIPVPKIKLNNRFGWTRYAVLILLVGIVPFFTREPWFSKLCPVGTLEAGIPLIFIDDTLREMIGRMFIIKISILVIILLWMMFSKRPFCRFVCPLGVIYGLFSRFSRLRLKVDLEKCTRCDQCKKKCPTDIKIYREMGSSQCIRCLECVKTCPASAITIK